MKSYFLGTICILIGIATAPTTARADIDFSDSDSDTISISATPAPRETMPQSNRQATAANYSELNSIEVSIFNLVNKYRQTKNLPPLSLDPAISAQAKLHSNNMAKTGVMTHEGFHERTDSVAQTIVYRSAAENLAYNMGYAKPDIEAIKGWIESPTHQKNMVGRFDLTGIGVTKNAKGEYYFTQIFIRKAWYVKDAD